MTKITEEQLQAWFEQYRHQYFGGRLSKWKVAIGSGPEPDINVLAGYCDDKSKTLYIKKRMLHTEESAQSTLLHEMCHAAVGPWHGKRFEAEIKRLMKQGAPIPEAELMMFIRIPAEVIRQCVDDGLMDGLSLEQAQTWVANEEFGLTREQFIKKYPKASQGTPLARKLYLEKSGDEGEK